MSAVEDGYRHAEARVLRALSVGGRRLVRRRGVWGVFANGDMRRRPITTADDAVISRMRAAGELVLEDEGLVTSRACAQRETTPVGALKSSLRGRHSAARTKPGFEGLAAAASRGEGALTAAQARAGRQFQLDVEAASIAGRTTMDWAFAPSNKSPRFGRGVGGAGASARRRLLDLQRSIGHKAFQLVFTACIDGAPIKALETRFALPRRGGARALSEALEAVRTTYDQKLARADSSEFGA